MSRSLRTGVDSVVGGLQSAAHFWSASRAPLDTYGAHPVPSLLSRSLEEIRNVVDEGPPFSLSDLPAYVDAVANIGGTIDDRKYFLEKILTLMARLGNNVEFSRRLQHVVINILYKDLPHPPCSYLALPPPSHLVGNLNQSGDATRPQPVNYAYRSADGSYYNPLIPTLGMAGSPYARSVPSQRSLSHAALPPPELVFDTLLKRDKFVEHPGGISSLFFAFADIIIHNIFDTDAFVRGWTINRASSYLDLSPLYGTSQEAVNSVRRLDGTGRLHDDVFADPRLLNMPPAVGALLIMFNRNHNYVAEKILSINENGNLKNPPPTDSRERDAQDEEVFQRARLVNTALFMQVILRDYVGAILGLARDGSPWRLDPLMSSRDPDHEVSPRGQGNVVSVEFNLLYRWHATVSEEDMWWTEKHFKDTMPSFDPKTGSVHNFMINAAGVMNSSGDVKQRTFGGLSRENGRFRDADLAKILQNATAAPASAFKARGTPEVLRVIEILSIEQGRKWGVCTLNEFRKFMGLKPYASFEDWNNDEEIARAAEALYHDIDNLELYVGMQAEQAKEPQPGAGLCPGFTISRAILSDAVALTRGDRFLTVDYTPLNLTAWGFDDCHVNESDGSYGGVLTKLLFRHLPDYYPSGSTFAHFPFLVPGKMKGYAQKLPGNVDRKYDWNRPAQPVGPTVVASKYSEVQRLFANPAIFSSGVARRLEILTGGVPLNRYTSLVEDVLTRPKPLGRATDAFKKITQELIKQAASKGASPYLDVVREVINFIPVHWLSNEIIGLPLKSAKNRGGVFTEQGLSTSLANIANYVYCNKDRESEWVLREQSQKAIHDVEPFLRGHLARLTRGSVNIEGITDSVLRWVSMWNDHSDDFLRDLVEATGSQSGNSALDGLAGSLLASVMPTAALFSQIIAHVVDFYIGTDRAKQIAQLAEKRENAQIMPFIFEALRLNPPLSSVLLEAQSRTEIGGTVYAERQHVLASIVGATHDASTFKNAETANYERPTADTERILGLDRRGLLSPKLFEQIAPIVLGEIFNLKNLRRYPPQSGPIARRTERTHNAPEQFYTDLNGRITPFPVSLFVQFDV